MSCQQNVEEIKSGHSPAHLFGNLDLWATKAREPWGVIVACHDSKDVEPDSPPTDEEFFAPR